MIYLPGGYAMIADENCFVIGIPYTNPKNGNTDLRKKLYYTSLSLALEGTVSRIMRDKVADESITDLQGIIEQYEKLRDEMKHLLIPLE